MKKTIYLIMVVVLSLITFTSCKENGSSLNKYISNISHNVYVNKIQKSEISIGFLSQLRNHKTNNNTRFEDPFIADSISEAESMIDTDNIYEFIDSDKDLILQAGISKINPNLIIGAYYSNDQKNEVIVLQIEQITDNSFILRDKYNAPIIELTYDDEIEVATCTQVFSQARAYSYLCNGAMAVLGWQVSTILAVPTGGASAIGFAILWAVVSTSYCG